MKTDALKNTLFTIGHSTHSLDRFLALLKQHGITALCDVRSAPYSRFSPQFNSENLKQALSGSGIAYVFLGAELGARSSDPSCYEHGKVQYHRLAQADIFKEGLDRVLEGVKDFKMGLMCTEKDPLECHRTILISRCLETLGLNVQHIRADGTLECHQDALLRLIHQLNLPENDMFRSREEILSEAYQIQSERIAFSRNDNGVDAIRSSVG